MMKNMTKALLFALTIPLSTSMAFAQGNDDHKMHDGMKGKHKQGMMRVYKKLDLSDTQQQQIKDIFKQAKQNRNKISKDDRMAKRDEWRALMKAESFDAAKAKALISQRQSHMLENELARVKARYDAYQVLNAEQKAKFDDMVEKKLRKYKQN